MSLPRRDPYEVLGVPRDAKADVIKRAYREHALRDHPDRNPGDTAAEERFKSASEAYATLRDPDARGRYDAYVAAGGGSRGGVGFDPRAGGAPRPDFTTVDWRTVFQEAEVPLDWSRYGSAGTATTGNVVFDVLFRGVTRAFRQAGLLPGEDRTVPLRLDLETARRGGMRRVRVPGPIACPSCRPDRAVATDTCDACAGTGVLKYGLDIDVRVPAGVRPGQKLRLQQMGGPGRPPGDAYVELEVALPPGIRREGRGLHGELFLTPLEGSRGAAVQVAGTRVQVPVGARDGQLLR
ncbi:MAG: DnaJ domain-containing protein, partial [bacterium]|nr:DnaJ domain-containing protein [bacterium]